MLQYDNNQLTTLDIGFIPNFKKAGKNKK